MIVTSLLVYVWTCNKIVLFSFFLFVPSVPFFSFIAILCIVYLSPEIYVYDRITPELCGRVMRVATFFLFLILTDAIFFSFYFFLDIFCVS